MTHLNEKFTIVFLYILNLVINVSGFIHIYFNNFVKIGNFSLFGLKM